MKTFIEIGAADFDTLLTLEGWRGIICEPHPVFYQMLVSKNKNANINILNVAVSSHNGRSILTGPSEKYINMINDADEHHHWIKGISRLPRPGYNSLIEKVIEERGLDSSFISEFDVKTITLNQLVYSHGLEHIDFLKSDAEGHDLQILEAYDWVIRPTLIKVEHRMQDDPDPFTPKLIELFDYHDYAHWLERDDIYAVSKK